MKAESEGGALEISFDLSGQKKIDLDSIILNSPEQQKTSSSEEEWLDVDTGNPASTSKVSLVCQTAPNKLTSQLLNIAALLCAFLNKRDSLAGEAGAGG